MSVIMKGEFDASMLDVEHARINALAGGPTNEYDAWLLERYGCYSGTPSAFCEGLAHGRHWHRAYRRRDHNAKIRLLAISI